MKEFIGRSCWLFRPQCLRQEAAATRTGNGESTKLLHGHSGCISAQWMGATDSYFPSSQWHPWISWGVLHFCHMTSNSRALWWKAKYVHELASLLFWLFFLSKVISLGCWLLDCSLELVNMFMICSWSKRSESFEVSQCYQQFSLKLLSQCTPIKNKMSFCEPSMFTLLNCNIFLCSSTHS